MLRYWNEHHSKIVLGFMRILIAYGLIAFLVVSAAAFAGWLRYNSRENRIRRQRNRERMAIENQQQSPD